MVWGAIGYHAPGVLVVLPSGVTMNSQKYRALLRNNLNECFRKCRIKRSKGVLQQKQHRRSWPGHRGERGPVPGLRRGGYSCVRSVQQSVNDGGDEEYYLVAAQGYDLVPERGSRDLRIRRGR